MGVSSAWADIYVFRVPSGTSINGDMNVTSHSGLVDCVSIDGNTYDQLSEDIPLISGWELQVYIVDPDNIQLDDIDTSVSISVSTNNAQYITEVNVECATAQ